MPESKSTAAERGLQDKFSIARLVAIVLLGLSVLLADQLIGGMPNRQEIGRRSVEVRFDPVRLAPEAFAPLRLVGAWRVSVDDDRFGGVSALALDEGTLTALTDSGVVIRLPRPGTGQRRALLDELPAGPGNPRFKRNRDSEALLADPSGRGWWVAFERRDQIWLYDCDFEQPLKRVRLGGTGWGINSGIEAIAPADGGLLAIPETGGALRIDGSRATPVAISGLRGPVSEAAQLPGGAILLVERRLTAAGMANTLVELERSGPGFRAGRRIRLPLSPMDNVEALAAEAVPGAIRLWLMTDDDSQRPLRTLLIALDMPGGSAAAASGTRGPKVGCRKGAPKK